MNATLSEVLMGLSRSRKSLPPKLLYDKRGSEIFERICDLEDYYVTRAEKAILEAHAPEMASLIGDDAVIIEPGSGSCEKIRTLLPHLSKATYVPVEICAEMVERTCVELTEEFPDLTLRPVCADFTASLDVEALLESTAGKRVIFFPGSTIGNFTPQEAADFLRQWSRVTGSGGGLLIGADLKKDAEILNRAYDDREGVTAAFNLNLLRRINSETDASFDLDCFEHAAFYNPTEGRVEMHLRSKVDQMVRVHETLFRFHEGETIHTESSYKYSVDEFIGLAAKAGLSFRKLWKDPQGLFCVYYFERE